MTFDLELNKCLALGELKWYSVLVIGIVVRKQKSWQKKNRWFC